MKNKLIYLMLATILQCCYMNKLSAQHCGNLQLSNSRNSDSNYNQSRQTFENDIQNYYINRSASVGSMTYIDVVVHVVHNNGIENISDAQIISQIDELNRIYRNHRGSTNPYAADCNIEFRLAVTDPNCVPTNGIDRIVSASSTNITFSNTWQAQDLALKNLSRWDVSRYLNIYVVRSIDNGYTQGYAIFPWDPLNAAGHDGVVIEYRSFGTTGNVTAPWHLGGVTAHEVGHWLGLYHTFGDEFNNPSCFNNNCLTDGDKVCDTPPEFNYAVGCPSAQNTCSSDMISGVFTSDVDDPYDNYMDYTDDACLYTFTQGQKDRIDFTLQTIRTGMKLNCCHTFLTGVNTLNNQDFNYGQFADEGLGGSLTLTNNSHLYVNADRPTQSGSNPGQGSICNLSVCGDLEIGNGCSFELGEDVPNNFANVLLRSGSRITIKGGGILLVKQGSSLLADYGSEIYIESGGIIIIEEGATIHIANNASLVYEKNADIRLMDFHAVLDISGILQLKDNADFTFTHPGASRHGYVRFSQTDRWPSRNIIAGNNCSMTFTGHFIPWKILEIEQETFYAPDNLVAFTMNTGTVVLWPDSRLQAPGGTTVPVNISLSSLKFTSNTPGVNNLHRGLQLFGQPNVNISFCTFEYGLYGINAFLTYGGAPLTLNGCTFRKCTTGIYSQDKGVTMNYCNFFNCAKGWDSFLMSFPCRTNAGVAGGTYTSANTSAIKYSGSSTGPLWLDDPLINNNVKGVENIGMSVITTHCGTVSYNSDCGFYVGILGSLFMDGNVSPAGAQVTAVNNTYTVKLQEAMNLALNNGYNDITPSGSHTQHVLFGSMLPGGTFSTASNHNKWNTSGNFGGNDFNVVYAQTTIQVPFSDQAPMSIVTACGQANPPCNPPCDQLKDALVYCPLCDVINTDDFDDARLNAATAYAIQQMQSNQPGNYRESIRLFYQILSVQYQNPDEREQYLLTLNYFKMAEALGNAFATSQVIPSKINDPLPEEITMMLDIQDRLYQRAVAAGDRNRQWFYTFDKAMTYRLAERRVNALSILNDLYNLSEGDMKDLTEQAVCAVTIEEGVVNHQIKKEDAPALLEGCRTNNGSRLSGNILAAETVVNDQENNAEVYPNPADDVIHIRSGIADGTVTVRNMLNEVVYAGNLYTEEDIDVSSFTPGVYLIEISGKQSKKVQHYKISVK